MNRAWRSAGIASLVVVPGAFLVATSGWPLVALALRAVRDHGTGTIGEVFDNARMARLAAVTVGQAVLSAALAVALGVPCAYCHARYRVVGSRVVWLAIAVPFVLPTVVVAAAIGRLQRTAGLTGDGGAWVAIVAAHVVVNLAVVIRTVGVRIASIDPAIEEAARLCGRSALGAAWCALRAARDAVMSAAVVVFLFCATSFGIIAVLGGGSVGTIEVEIWFQATQLLRLDVAALLSFVQMGVVALVVVVALRSRRDRVVVLAAGRRRRPRGAARVVLMGLMLVQGAAAFGPIAVLVERSLRVEGAWGLDHYRHLGRALRGTGLASSPWRAAVASLEMAGVAAAIAVIVGVAAAAAVAMRRRGARLVDAALLIPLATSAATVGFGILVAYSRPPLDVRGSWWALPIVEASIAAPLVARSLAPVFAAVDRRQIEAASLLGARASRRLRAVILPAVRPAVGVAAGLAFAVALGEFGATAFLARSGSPTLPQLMVRLLGRPGDANLGQAMAVGVVMAALTAGVFAVAEAFGRGRSLEF